MNGFRTAKVDEMIDRRSYGSARVEHIIEQDNFVVDVERNLV